MEELNEICEILMEKCACSWVRDRTNDTQDKYSALMSQIQGTILVYNIVMIFILIFTNILLISIIRHPFDYE